MFLLAYGGLHWGFADVLALTSEQRQWFVERLKFQKDYEAEELNKK